jgi:hypothetical protein
MVRTIGNRENYVLRLLVTPMTRGYLVCPSMVRTFE